MRRVLLANLRAHAARLVASTLAVVIAVGFVVATLVLEETSRATLLRAVGAQYVGTAAVVTATDGSDLSGDVATVAAAPGVRAVAPSWQTSVQAVLPGRAGARFLRVDSVADDAALRWEHLAAGRLPAGPGQVAVSAQTHAAVGDVLTVTTLGADGPATTSRATVTGVVDLQGDPTSGVTGRLFVTAAQARAWGAGPLTELRVAADPGTSADTVTAAVADALRGRPATVATGSAAAQHQAAELIGGTRALTAVLLVFGTVAVVVAGLVIANTFAVLLAQRTRELALLRCVGATARQVRRSVLGEALATGLAASALGVGAGTGLAAAVSALAGGADSPIPLAGVAVPRYAVVAGLGVGTGVTLLAALAPARAATRVSPLAALRPLDPAPLRSRPGALRLVLGLVLLVPGVGLLALGVLTTSVLVALAGGVASFLGIVLLAQRAVPPVVAAAGRLTGRLGGVPARLAAGNASRNPRRTAATATALLIGVTLTTAMVVGAASTRATASAELDAAFPADVAVAGPDLPRSLAASLGAVPGVRSGVALATAEVEGPVGSLPVLGVDPAAARSVLRSTAGLVLPRPGQLVLTVPMERAWGVRAGTSVRLTGPAGARTLTVSTGKHLDTPLLTSADLTALTPGARIGSVWLRLADGGDQSAVVDRVTDRVATLAPGAAVSGLASERAGLDRVLDTLLLVVTGLLGVAVLIALIGVGNTLALSVVERRQENGLLRALGLTRRQLRGTLAWEAALVAGVAAVLGVLLGGGYGVIGAASLLGGRGGTVLAVPVLQVVVIVVVATAAGVLASVLPARRAARTSPVAALAA